MTDLRPLRDIAHLGLALRPDQPTVAPWVPLSHTEMQIASLHFPIAIRMEEASPTLGLVLDDAYLRRPVLDPKGKWRGGYQPLAVRCAPLRCSAAGGDPLRDIMIAFPSDYIVERGGTPVIDESGAPSPFVRTVHRFFGLLQASREKFSEAIDQLFIGNLLVPLDPSNANGSRLYLVDGTRFAALEKRALAAMARQRFTALDVAAACLSSQRLLHDRYRPRPIATAAVAQYAQPLSYDHFLGKDFELALDDDELISLAEFEA